MKTMKWLAMLLLAMLLTSTFSACSDKNDEEEEQGGSGGGTPEGTLTSEETKERLSQIGKDFLDAIPQSDFDELDQLANYIRTTYCDRDGQTEAVEDWAEDCFDNLVEATLNDKITSYATYKYTRRIYELSQFRAHLSYNTTTEKWDVQKGTNDLQATCTDQNGQAVLFKLTSSGRTQKVYIGEIEMDKGYDNGQNIYEYDQAYIVVPAQINITLTRGGKTLVNVEVTTDLSSMTSENFDLSKDAATVTVKTQLAGYDIQCKRIAASANTDSGVQAKFSIVKSSKTLLTAEVIGTVNLPAGLVWQEGVDDDAFEQKLENFTGKVTVCKLDLLGKLQVTAVCSDARKIFDAFERAEDYKMNADSVNACAKDANNSFVAQFSYDGANAVQGTMELEAAANEKGTKYYLEPVVVFSDGSRYNMTDDSYFNEENFKSFIDLFDALCDKYEKMVEKYDDDDYK